MTTSAHSCFSLPIYLFALLLSALALYGFWFDRGRAVALPEIVGAGHKLQCVSYSPFAKDQSPLVQSFTLRAEQMDADLALLARYFSCVRTYSVTGLAELPALAQKHGLKILLGAWVSADPKATQLEIEQLVAIANHYPDVVQAVVIGNEALLRKEISGPRLAELITQVKSRVKQPVTYADVWEFWLKNPQVAPTVDFITIHLLPYWEDQPTGIEGDEALQHVADVREQFGHLFPEKDILIGETGWPSEGRQREMAVPNRVSQARFVRGFVALAEHNGWNYNLIEAFDQPWKRQNEGAVGGYWGLFDADRQDKQILAGPVSNLPRWRQWWQVSAAIAAAVLLVAGRPRSVRAALLLPALAAVAGVCLALWWQLAVNDNRNPWEWLWTAALTLLNAVVLIRAGWLLCGSVGWRARLLTKLELHAGQLLLLSGFVGALLTLQLVFDARYREFPSAILLLPAVVYALLPTSVAVRETLLLAAIIAAGIPLQLWQEKLTNHQALGWAVTALLLVLALGRSLRTSRSAAINSANTAGVTV